MTEPGARSIEEMQQVTREYASYSQSRSGWGSVLGGIAGLAAFVVIWLIGPGVIAATLTVVATTSWLVGKEIIRRMVYRRLGEASEIWPPSQRREHSVAVTIISAVLAVLALLIVLHILFDKPDWSRSLPYLVFCLATPWIAWRYLRTNNELMVGVFLLMACAISAAGFTPDRVLFTAILPLYSVLLIGIGLKEDRQYRALAARLRARQAAGT
jgi:hypothetical protein